MNYTYLCNHSNLTLKIQGVYLVFFFLGNQFFPGWLLILSRHSSSFLLQKTLVSKSLYTIKSSLLNSFKVLILSDIFAWSWMFLGNISEFGNILELTPAQSSPSYISKIDLLCLRYKLLGFPVCLSHFCLVEQTFEHMVSVLVSAALTVT